MSFPVPGDAIEQSLDLNRHLIQNPAATFFVRVEGDIQASQEVQPGDLLVVDRSQTVTDNALVVAILHGEMVVLRLSQQPALSPAEEWDSALEPELEVWGVVTTIIRPV
ncbi:MAG TPA: S24 family peptidase [Trichocoleus sp.]